MKRKLVIYTTNNFLRETVLYVAKKFGLKYECILNKEHLKATSRYKDCIIICDSYDVVGCHSYRTLILTSYKMETAFTEFLPGVFLVGNKTGLDHFIGLIMQLESPIEMVKPFSIREIRLLRLLPFCASDNSLAVRMGLTVKQVYALKTRMLKRLQINKVMLLTLSPLMLEILRGTEYT